jgi:hypothetical protein
MRIVQGLAAPVPEESFDPTLAGKVWRKETEPDHTSTIGLIRLIPAPEAIRDVGLNQPRILDCLNTGEKHRSIRQL